MDTMPGGKRDKAGGASLADAFAEIIDAKLPTGNPILAKRKGLERAIAKAEAEEAEANALVRAKRALKETAHQPLPRAVPLSGKTAPKKRKQKQGSSAQNIAREKMLKKVATRGVVALFNAVRGAQRGQQTELGDGSAAEPVGRAAKKQRKAAADAGGDASGSKPEEVSSAAPRPACASTLTHTSLAFPTLGAQMSRESFLDVLRRGTTRPPERSAPAAAAQPARGGASYLRDDFLLGKNRARDWERAVEEEDDDLPEGGEHGVDVDDD